VLVPPTLTLTLTCDAFPVDKRGTAIGICQRPRGGGRPGGRRRDRADVGVAAGTNNALNALGGVFGVAVMAAVFAAHGSYACSASFIAGFRPAEWAAAAVAGAGVIAAVLAPSRRQLALSLAPATAEPAILQRRVPVGCPGAAQRLAVHREHRRCLRELAGRQAGRDLRADDLVQSQYVHGGQNPPDRSRSSDGASLAHPAIAVQERVPAMVAYTATAGTETKR